MSATDTDRLAELRAAWTEVHGPPNEAAEELLRQNPSYFERVLDFTAHAWRRGPLPPKSCWPSTAPPRTSTARAPPTTSAARSRSAPRRPRSSRRWS